MKAKKNDSKVPELNTQPADVEVGGPYDPRADGTWDDVEALRAKVAAIEAAEDRGARMVLRVLSECSPRRRPRTGARRRGTRCRNSASSDDDGGDDGSEVAA